MLARIFFVGDRLRPDFLAVGSTPAGEAEVLVGMTIGDFVSIPMIAIAISKGIGIAYLWRVLLWRVSVRGTLVWIALLRPGVVVICGGHSACDISHGANGGRSESFLTDLATLSLCYVFDEFD